MAMLSLLKVRQQIQQLNGILSHFLKKGIFSLPVFMNLAEQF